MDDLIAFLRARLDEDEAVAREASRFQHDDRPMTPGGEHWHWVEPDGDQVLTLDPVQDEYLNDGGRAALHSVEEYPTGNPWTLPHMVLPYGEEVRTTDAMHIARWDPARVLAEVEAKREILDEYLLWAEDDSRDYDQSRTAVERSAALEVVVKVLALPYAGHADYRPEWRS